MNSFFLLFLSCAIILISLIRTSYAEVDEHQTISSWEGTATCLQCHQTEGLQVFNSVHYQWLGQTPYLNDGPDIQGKLDMGVNSYCINITGNWEGCSSCHAGLGKRPTTEPETEQLENIDCLVCHQQAYKRKRVGESIVPDTDAMSISMVEAARTVHLPNRITCLQCHAKGGGGDNYKRGDMALAHGSTTDSTFDIHMANTGAGLTCQSCHITEDHLMAGRGSDLRPTDLDREMQCVECHQGKDSSDGHDTNSVNRHVARVSCQACHIPLFAKNASDTEATEQTEIHRDWRQPHTTASGAIHPTPTMAGNLVPEYLWWNGKSSTYLLYEKAVTDPGTGRIPTARPAGSVSGINAKLFPFKYKTATQPLADNSYQLIALDTRVYFATGDVAGSVESGLANMGYSRSEPYSWVETDTFQLITHEVSPAADVLQCSDCHSNSGRINFTELGYALKSPRSELCITCHGKKDGEDEPEYLWIHAEHVREERFDCSWCHNFSRPERNLTLHPLFENLSLVINVLRILVGLPSATIVPDVDGDGKTGLAEALHFMKTASDYSGE